MDHLISSTQEIRDGKVSQIEQLYCVRHSLKAKMAFFTQLLTITNLAQSFTCASAFLLLQCFLFPRANSCSCIFAVEGAYNSQVNNIEFENLHEP